MATERPSVVWLTLESVRADHTSVHGYERDTTPNLRRITAGEGATAFSNCFAQSMWTPACSASILTGTYMSTHGVGMDGRAKQPLPDELETLPELLRGTGYSTACLSPNPYLTPTTGLDRGFEKFRWLSLRSLLSRELVGPLASYAARVGSYGPPFARRSFYGGESPLVQTPKRLVQYGHSTYTMTELLKDWIDGYEASGEPFFVYGHLPNPHHVYKPPRKFIERFTRDIELSTEEALQLSYDVYASSDDMKRRIAMEEEFTDAEREALHALYDAEIAYVDECVGRLYDHVRETCGEDTIFVVTGDHGDLFGEQGVLGHNLVLHDGLTHVPLVVDGLDGVSDAADGLVQHIDVTKTLAERLGVGREQFEGTSLDEERPEYVVSQRGVALLDVYKGLYAGFDEERYHREPMTALRTERFKYVESADRAELFELPDEETDASDDHPEVFERLANEKAERFGDIRREGSEADEIEFSDEQKQQLADLGYI